MQFVELDTMEIKYSAMEIIINLIKKFLISTVLVRYYDWTTTELLPRFQNTYTNAAVLLLLAGRGVRGGAAHACGHSARRSCCCSLVQGRERGVDLRMRARSIINAFKMDESVDLHTW